MNIYKEVNWLESEMITLSDYEALKLMAQHDAVCKWKRTNVL